MNATFNASTCTYMLSWFLTLYEKCVCTYRENTGNFFSTFEYQPCTKTKRLIQKQRELVTKTRNGLCVGRTIGKIVKLNKLSFVNSLCDIVHVFLI